MSTNNGSGKLNEGHQPPPPAWDRRGYQPAPTSNNQPGKPPSGGSSANPPRTNK